MADPLADTTSSASSAPVAAWAAALHRQGADTLGSGDVPSEKEEDWRHTDTSRIPWGPGLSEGGDDPGDDVARGVAARFGGTAGLVLTWGGGSRVVEPPAEGVVLDVLESGEAGAVSGSIVAPGTDVFAASNAARFVGGALVGFAPGARPPGPVVVVHWGGPSASVTFPRTLVRAGADSEASVVEVWAGPADTESNLVAATVELDVADGARLDHVVVQEVGDATVWISNQGALVGRGARVRTTAAALGASLSRLRAVTTLAGEGAESDAIGVYLATGERHMDFRVTQRHVAPHCRSDLRFHGAAWDSASSVFSGLIRIEAEAAHSVAHQASHYLLLSEHARAANIPTLEILNHDVRCGHASSGGPPDDDQLHYLAARAIPPEVAQRLVIDGFFADVTARMPLPGVRAHVGAEVQRRLDQLRAAP